MNNESVSNENKANAKTESSNIFILNSMGNSKAQSPNNIFLLPSEEERNRSNHLQNKFNHFIQGQHTFSDYSTDDAFYDNSQSDAFKDFSNNYSLSHKSSGIRINTEKDDDDDESSCMMHKRRSFHSIGPSFARSNADYDSNASEDESIFNDIQSNQMRKLNSHQAIQMHGTNHFIPRAINNNDNSKDSFNEHNVKQNILSEAVRSKINSTNNALKTFHLITKRKYRSTGKSAYYVFTDGERVLFNIYQNNQTVNLFEVYSDVQTPIYSTSLSGIKSTTALPLKNSNEADHSQIYKSQSSFKSTQIQTGKSITSTNPISHVSSTKSANPPIATLQMIDTKGSQFILFKNDTNGEILLKIQYMKTNYSGCYRSTIVTFHKNDSSGNSHSGIPANNYHSSPQSTTSSSFDISSEFSVSSETKKQRLWSKQPPLGDEGKPVFSCQGNKFFIDSIRNMNLCKKNQDRVLIAVRKTDQNELEIDAFFRANLLWLVGIVLSDALSSVY